MHFYTKNVSPLVLATLVFSLSVCWGVNKSSAAERPKDEAFRTELKKELSSLNVPIEASSEEIGKALNQVVRKELYKGSSMARGVSAEILRNGSIAVSAADNFLYFTVPVTMSLSSGMFETQAIPLKLKFKATARVSPDWKLITDIYYIGLSDLLAEEIGVGPFSINARSIVDEITQPVQKVLSDVVNRKINEMFMLKIQVAKAWNAAQKPVLLDRNYNVWLKMTPREVLLSPLSAQNNRVKVNVGIISFAEMVVGPEPSAPPPVPLPNLRLVNTFDRNFHITLNADLFFKDILTIASPLLLNKEFDADGKTIVIKDLDLYGNGDKIVINIETKGSLEGVFYLTGKPRFDPRTNIFSVDEVDFDMQSQSILLQSADWFLHSMIRSRIQEMLTIDLTQRLDQSRDMARKAIAQVKLADKVILKGDIKTLKFNDALVQKDKISIQVSTEGESAIFFQ